MRKNPFVSASTLLAALLAPIALAAQDLRVERLPLLASEQDDIGRLRQLAGIDSTRPQTLRAPSRLIGWDSTTSIALLAPELFVGYNSDLAQGFNDGALWQGRGLNLRLTTGVAVRWGRVQLILAPQVVSAANLDYQVIHYPQRDSTSRSVWANPFHPAPEGIDLPLRHGSSAILQVDPGQSSLVISFDRVEAGLSTENVWWGPGMQNALLLGSQASGVPSAFIRAARPLEVGLGTWDFWLAIGALRESGWFDRDDTNDTRSLAALAVTWNPRRLEGLEVGLGRIVISAGAPTPASLIDPFRSVGRPNTTDSLSPGARDQITSLWARWAAPASGFEAWAEWARFEEPASIRDFLEFPGHSQGYTLGLQWLREFSAGAVRAWAEATYLEPSASLRVRPVGTTYVSRAVQQGFTHRGEMLGPGIGPGSSGQWIASDWLQGRWRAGAYLGRVRWDNAVLPTPVVPPEKREDVSLVGGLRAGYEVGRVRVLIDWAHSTRLNYLFQAYLADPVTGRTEGIDIINDAVTLTISTPVRGIR